MASGAPFGPGPGNHAPPGGGRARRRAPRTHPPTRLPRSPTSPSPLTAPLTREGSLTRAALRPTRPQAGQEAFKKLHWDARMVHLVPKNAQVTSVGIPLLFTSYALYSLGRVSAATVLSPGRAPTTLTPGRARRGSTT